VTALFTGLAKSAQVEYVAGDPNAFVSIFTASRTSVVGKYVPLSIFLRDTWGNPVAGAKLNLSSTEPRAHFVNPETVRAADGKARTMYKSSVAGAQTLRALWGQDSVQTTILLAAANPNSSASTDHTRRRRPARRQAHAADISGRRFARSRAHHLSGLHLCCGDTLPQFHEALGCLRRWPLRPYAVDSSNLGGVLVFGQMEKA
jgi:hypothetical protein